MGVLGWVAYVHASVSCIVLLLSHLVYTVGIVVGIVTTWAVYSVYMNALQVGYDRWRVRGMVVQEKVGAVATDDEDRLNVEFLPTGALNASLVNVVVWMDALDIRAAHSRTQQRQQDQEHMQDVEAQHAIILQ